MRWDVSKHLIKEKQCGQEVVGWEITVAKYLCVRVVWVDRRLWAT